VPLEFRILGPVEVVRDGEQVALGAAKQRELLGILLLHAGETVAASRLIDELWEEHPPETAANTLQVYVSRLRRALGDGVIETRPPGYALVCEPEAIDAVRFERLLRDGRAADALALWRGDPELDAARLEELRAAAIEERVEDDLEAGRHADVVRELEALVRAHPQRERLRGQLMLALYRSGRQGDALKTYRAAREYMLDELGLDPSPELQQLERDVLAQAPALAAPAAPLRRPLPAPPTPLIGRDDELEQVLSLLRRADVRLLTLTGPGGVGKTRLALEAARRLEAEVESTFVALGSLREPELLAAAIAAGVGAAAEHGETELDAAVRELAGRPALLVLDNFEQLVEAAAVVGRLIAAAPELTVLTTSREALRLRGERELAVPPLAPRAAERLFTERAEAADPAFASTPEVAAICERLEGLPLAIELAAARTKVLDAAALLQRLERRLPVLVGGARDLPERQRTLEATLDWSHELLDEEEQRAFARLSVFAGGCEPAAAEVVCETSLEVLASLVDKSLVRRAEGRLRMLETIREYAAGRLGEDGTRGRHVAWFAALAEAADAELRGPEQEAWLARLDAEHANLRAAIAYALAAGDGSEALRVAAGLRHYWTIRSYLREGRRLLEDALAAAPSADPELRERALTGLGILTAEQGEFDVALGRFDEALAIATARGDEDAVARTVSNLANLAHYAGDVPRAKELYEEGLRLARTTKSERLIVIAENLAVLRLIEGDVEAADEVAREGIAAGRGLGNLRDLASILRAKARIEIARGDLDAAEAALAESDELSRNVGDEHGRADWLEARAALARARGDLTATARLLGEADAQRERIEVQRPPERQAWYVELEQAARAALGDVLFERERRGGRAPG
jgi:predicted ATPase/DNA-binding SARP family transcriptional activator